ncbi:hypothetical protein LSAT2_016196 [Lamellibrachia satsuma]|nr:hypothetical protein LSAT2_016196 [Lamellibrachia satsuma]
MRGERGRTLLLASCFVLAAITGLSEGGWERVCSLDDTTSNQGVCGKQLAQMLSLVCGLRGYQGVEKRTELCSCVLLPAMLLCDALHVAYCAVTCYFADICIVTGVLALPALLLTMSSDTRTFDQLF